jgi:hypothetical protein
MRSRLCSSRQVGDTGIISKATDLNGDHSNSETDHTCAKDLCGDGLHSAQLIFINVTYPAARLFQVLR